MLGSKNNVAAVAFLCLAFVIGHNNVVVESAKILGIFPTSSKSHWILGSALMKELAQDEHEVSYWQINDIITMHSYYHAILGDNDEPISA